jgi:integrase
MWSSGALWGEANLWFLARSRLLLSGQLKVDTIGTNGKDLLAYADWLELSGMHWWQCHPRDDQRPLNLYRGHLVSSYEQGVIAPTLASRRMATLKTFYRWLLVEEILSPGYPLWSERNVRVTYEDAFGFRRHIEAVQTSLDIKAAKRIGEVSLEDGLQPVSLDIRDSILDLVHRRSSYELFLMLSLGFWSGLRLGTICDLKIQTIENAVAIHGCSALKHINIGPKANPPVQMKLGQGSDGIVVPTQLLERLLDYSVSLRRGKRMALAKPKNKHLLFLTKFGNPYGGRGPDRSPTVNAEMSRLKRIARTEGLNIDDFTFHWSRATFATMWARAARTNGHLHEFMPTLKRMLAHKHDRTTEQYIHWVEKEEVRAAVMDEFTRTMFGRFYQAAGEIGA